MQARYRLRNVTTFEPVPGPIVGGLEYEDRYDVCEFVPGKVGDPRGLPGRARPRLRRGKVRPPGSRLSGPDLRSRLGCLRNLFANSSMGG